MAAIFRKILCPVDFSDNSVAALEQAAGLARKDDALLYLMHVVFIPMGNPAELAHYEVKFSTEPDKLRLGQVAREHVVGVRHEVLVQAGRPAELIEGAAQDLDVDLIVMATHGRTGISHLFLGSVAEHVIRASKRSVLSFGPRTTIGGLKEILCPVDLAPESIAALKFAARLAQKYGSALDLLHVVPVPFEPSEIPVEPPTPEWKQDARARLAKCADENLGADVECNLLARRGDPAGAILEVENELRPDLVVMGTHGRTGLSHLALGSVAERTVRESSVPVLTVRERHRAA
jgi:nucleotide-binding universal stress UspA family protein